MMIYKMNESERKKMNMVKILLIDDDEFILEDVEDVLNEYGYQTITANNGIKGLNLLREHHDIDLVISDLQMPPYEWGGLWLVEQLRDTGDVPIIILSDKSAAAKASDSIKAGASDYCDKARFETDLIPKIVKVLLDFQKLKEMKMKMISSYYPYLQEIIGSHTWINLSEETKQMLGNAEMIFHKHSHDSHFDFSQCIVPLIKAVEVECNKTFVPSFIQYLDKHGITEQATLNLYGKNTPLDKIKRGLMLAELSTIMRYPFILDYSTEYRVPKEELESFTLLLDDLRSKYERNKAVHSDIIKASKFEPLRAALLGVGKTSPFTILQKFSHVRV
jgi:CheY-like chemotaxis protein